MSTSLLNCEIELSKQMGDFWDSTSTSAGAAGGTTIVDTALKAKENDWITDECYDMVTSGTYDEEERRISSLDNSTGTLTVLAHGGQIASSVTYRVHRLFTASEKRRALVNAAKKAYPHIFKRIRDESMVSHNWLKDGSFEIWTSSSALTYWTKSASTLAKTTSSPYYKHGSTSCKIDTAAGYIQQSISNWDDLKQLAGKAVTFSIQGWCDTASCLRLSIYDGTTTTYSEYHDGDSAWTEDEPANDGMYVTATIADNPTEITFKILHAVDAGTTYVDDARVIGPYGARLYIGNLGLAQNLPHEVLVERANYRAEEPWLSKQGITYDISNGYMVLPYTIPRDYRLRVCGIGYLDFYDSSGDSGTDWDDTIDIDHPQTEILVAEAAIYLCNQMLLPTQTSGTSKQWANALNYWQRELSRRRVLYGMKAPPGTINFASL